MPLYLWVIFVVGVAILSLVIWRLLRWRDPSWDSEENQARSFLWSKRGSSGGSGF